MLIVFYPSPVPKDHHPRHFVGELTVSVTPLSRLLTPDYGRWAMGRAALCTGPISPHWAPRQHVLQYDGNYSTIVTREQGYLFKFKVSACCSSGAVEHPRQQTQRILAQLAQLAQEENKLNWARDLCQLTASAMMYIVPGHMPLGIADGRITWYCKWLTIRFYTLDGQIEPFLPLTPTLGGCGVMGLANYWNSWSN